MQNLVRALNRLHRTHPALHARDCEPEGFRWIEADDADRSVFAWLRFDSAGGKPVAVVTNFTPVPRVGHVIGLPAAGAWRVLLSTDEARFGGSGAGSMGEIEAEPVGYRDLSARAAVSLPPLGALYLEPVYWPPPERA